MDAGAARSTRATAGRRRYIVFASQAANEPCIPKLFTIHYYLFVEPERASCPFYQGDGLHCMGLVAQTLSFH